MAVVLALAACSGDGGGIVAMESGRVFEPEVLTVEAGDTVSFVSESEDAHTVTAYDEGVPEGASYFSSGDFDDEDEARADVAGGLLAPGDSFEVVLDIPGTYEYFCVPHEESGMTGRIVVE